MVGNAGFHTPRAQQTGQKLLVLRDLSLGHCKTGFKKTTFLPVCMCFIFICCEMSLVVLFIRILLYIKSFLTISDPFQSFFIQLNSIYLELLTLVLWGRTRSCRPETFRKPLEAFSVYTACRFLHVTLTAELKARPKTAACAYHFYACYTYVKTFCY